MAGCAQLLRKMPDRVPSDIVPGLQDKAEVIPVPLAMDRSKEVQSGLTGWPGRKREGCSRIIRLLWMGRFEHDKGADNLLRILNQLESAGLDYELAMTDQQFRQMPTVFSEIKKIYSHRLVQFGYVENLDQYHALLESADIVLSTALHEFQGLAVMEAVINNCIPIVPDRLVYPEIYPASSRYESCPDDPEKEARAAAGLILKVVTALEEEGVARPELSAFGIEHIEPLYKQVFHDIVQR